MPSASGARRPTPPARRGCARAAPRARAGAAARTRARAPPPPPPLPLRAARGARVLRRRRACALLAELRGGDDAASPGGGGGAAPRRQEIRRASLGSWSRRLSVTLAALRSGSTRAPGGSRSSAAARRRGAAAGAPGPPSATAACFHADVRRATRLHRADDVCAPWCGPRQEPVKERSGTTATRPREEAGELVVHGRACGGGTQASAGRWRARGQ